MNPVFIFKTNCRNARPSSLRTFAIAAGVSLLVVAGATSCSTTKGFGRDIEKTGEKIQDAAQR